jgi:hypothetical protein
MGLRSARCNNKRQPLVALLPICLYTAITSLRRFSMCPYLRSEATEYRLGNDGSQDHWSDTVDHLYLDTQADEGVYPADVTDSRQRAP